MVAGSGMLAFVLIIQLSYTWDMETHVYFTCVLHDFQIRGDDIANRVIGLFVPISVLYGTYEIVQLLYTKQPPRSEFRKRWNNFLRSRLLISTR